MITFLASLICLILGYAIYGKFVAKYFGADADRETPAQKLNDGVDFTEISPWRAFMIQLLNIAGLGPIFGAILGASYGPIAYLWIVLGCIFMGATHDFFSGAISMRTNGASLPELVGNLLGNGMRRFLTVFSGIMLLSIGIAFVSGPAGLLAELSAHLSPSVSDGGISASELSLPGGFSISWLLFWTLCIIVYYVLAVILPINKIIGTIYPFFSVALIFMALGVAGTMLWKDFSGTLPMQELTLETFKNFKPNPDANSIFPMLFIVISCGAISGFHATQSPMMARCLKSEKSARPIFYGAMIAEGVIALIWASAAIAYCGGAEGLNASGKAPAIIVNEICSSWFGIAGTIITVIGVIACPITSGDTAFRSVRLIIADALEIRQKPIRNRILISIPIFGIALLLSQIRFEVIWRYVGLANQILAAISLWAFSVWLVREKKPHWILSIPATFLTSVCVSYFLNAPHKLGGLALPYATSCILGILTALGLLAVFVGYTRRTKKL